MWLEYIENLERVEITEPRSYEICRSLEQCRYASSDDTVLLVRAKWYYWIESDGRTRIRFRQNEMCYAYYGGIDFPMLVYAFLSYANNDDAWKEQFEFEEEPIISDYGIEWFG